MPKFIPLPVASLVHADWNYKIQNTFLQERLVENIRRNGQVETIIVRDAKDGKHEVVNGNHRLAAFVTLGTESVVCCDLGEISDAAAQRIAIETNETRFDRDDLRFAAVLEEVLEDFPLEKLLPTMPFTEEEIQAARSVQTFDWQENADKPKAKKKNEVRFTITPEQSLQIDHARKVTGCTEDSLLFLQAVTALIGINQQPQSS